MKNLIDMLMAAAATDRQLTLIAGKGEEEQLSYRQLYQDARCLLWRLQQAGLQPGNELMLQFQSDIYFIKIFWACVIGGIIPVPVTFGVGETVAMKIANIWKSLSHPYLATDFSDYAARMEQVAAGHLVKERILVLKPTDISGPTAAPVSVPPEQIAFLQFSSGSTGVPKGVMNTHEGILQNLVDMARCFGLRKEDRFMGWMPLTHDMGMLFFHMLPLYLHASHYLIPPILFLTYPALWVESMARHRVTVSGSPNFGYRYVAETELPAGLSPDALQSVRILLNSAEPISIEVCQRFQATLAPAGLPPHVIRPAYGLAEATLGVAAQASQGPIQVHRLLRDQLNIGDTVVYATDNDAQSVSFVDLGACATTTAVSIMNTEGAVLPDNTVGLIKIKGVAVTGGYYNLPESRHQIAQEDGWLNTGDLGFMQEGRLTITGRHKEMIIIQGQNFYPNDLDMVAAELEWTKDRAAVACGIHNNVLHTDEVFFFVAYEGKMQPFIALMNSLRRHISTRTGVKVSRVIPVKQIPKTTSGKVQRFKLREDYLAGLYQESLTRLAEALSDLEPAGEGVPATAIEQTLAKVCAKALQLEGTLNIKDNFFDLGCTSLTIKTIRGMLEMDCNIVLDETVFYRYPNVKALGRYIREGQAGAADDKKMDRKAILEEARQRMKIKRQ
ncbi:acyl-CoA synthetase (AMP-forming)/AMP-acid ligase II [Chitinophaga polysaccharea]|uniref:Acyl-CoA synthetase (AMP-forming)/AMP-acid ligase II n=1 Tax=Chitinophaga polysaccharea TaxID=1293035 RepID=A0A561PWN8_9BACT|nr:AMP-binding protein [Chitinophaga polysaccharea]TWF42526.1 acyl-CoA synthetase (AMP-forming)/AMP-acid ligase II [Chitinophaga polysaccharea]